jgi:hypothetical protein
MTINLNSVGMKKNQQYETIISTKNEKNEKNAAPMGVKCSDHQEISCKIFKGSTTLNNITEEKEFIVNITENPILFTLSTIGNLPKEFFEENSIAVKDVDAYLKCKLIGDIRIVAIKSNSIQKTEAGIFKAEVNKIVLNKASVKAPNRGFYSLIESLTNYSRMDIVDEEKQIYFLDRLNESIRIINKIGSSAEKEAIEILKKAHEDKGYELDKMKQ